jgi:4-amino-4-deoxy-L-arabinose transferase-like glycosyltransferase
MARESSDKIAINRSTVIRVAGIVLAVLTLFKIYTIGIDRNPPGFYLDESGIAYNAFLVSQTGAGEFGSKFPLYFQLYTGGYTQFSNPTPVYVLAAVYLFTGPSILAARLTAAAAMFAACLLIGLLAGRISGQRSIGILVALFALFTPWLFEVGRLVMDPLVYMLVLVGYLWAVYLASERPEWSWRNIISIAAMLSLVTYSYTIGRLLAPLLALGLLFFAVNRKRFIGVVKTWAVYAITLIPLGIYLNQKPELMTRFRLISYIKPDTPYNEIIGKFVARYLQDINPWTMLAQGDVNPRHHIQDALGSFYFTVFLLALAGIVIAKYRNDPWWRYVIFGLLVSVVPGALTVDAFHTLRMIAYPLFLLVLTIPALEWLFKVYEKGHEISAISRGLKRAIGVALVVLLVTEAAYFHSKHYNNGPTRGYVFDSAYKQVYDTAVGSADRPIYLVDAYWGPAYIHSFWYATLEGRNKSEFVHQPYGTRPPPGSIVISSEQACVNCEMIRKEGIFLLYRTTK